MSEKITISSEEKIWASLSYVWVFALVALAAKKDNAFIRFHANQGALLFALSLAGIIPFFGQLWMLVLFVFSVIGLIKAYLGEKWPLPLLAEVAKDFGAWVIKVMKI